MTSLDTPHPPLIPSTPKPLCPWLFLGSAIALVVARMRVMATRVHSQFSFLFGALNPYGS